MKTKFQSHDLSLPAWGPYTKQYSGISHVPAKNNGVRFDLSVFPGYYRRRVDVPNVTFESGYHMWDARPDLSIMHPLPRVNEIAVAIDADPRACYFKQVLNGKYMRMALILKLLEV